MFDNCFFSQFLVTVGFVRAKWSFRPCIFYEVIMHELVKWDVFKFIERGYMKNWMVLCESHQDWF